MRAVTSHGVGMTLFTFTPLQSAKLRYYWYVVLALSTNFGTNRLGLGTAEPGAASILKVYRREGSMSGCELCCAPKSGMAPRRPFSY